MTEELRAHLQKLTVDMNIISVYFMLGILSFAGVFLFYGIGVIWSAFSGIICVSLAVLCVRYYRKIHDVNPEDFKPVVIDLGQKHTIESVGEALSALCAKRKDAYQFSEDSAFVLINKKNFKLRIFLYQTSDFVKKEYDRTRSKVNRKANKMYNLKQWHSLYEVHKHMRVNVVITENVNEELYNYISGNTAVLLTRAEGILNIVINGDKIIFPPLYGFSTYATIGRYKKGVKLFTEVLGK